jgi:dihydroxy-acid dehydratase
MDVSDEEIERRRKEWKAPPLKVSQGTLYKYTKVVSDASHGCGELKRSPRILLRPKSS